MSVKSYLKKYLKENNLTRVQFCKQIGINKDVLLRYVQDKGITLYSYKKIIEGIGYEIQLVPKNNS